MIRAPLTLPALYGAQPQAVPVAFNAQSEALLNGVNPQLAELMRRVEARMPDAFEISEGRRSQDRQAEMVAAGKSQTMNSRHLTGNAVDIHAIGPDGNPNWDFEAYRPIADAAKAEAAAMGIPDFVWGGDWRTLKDGVHFQVGGPDGGSVGSGTPLSFGADVPAVDTGLAGLYQTDPSAFNLGQPALPTGQNMLLANALDRQQRAESERSRRLALADLVRF